jgi:glycosyltransferase involved in cell wall biosynthesis
MIKVVGNVDKVEIEELESSDYVGHVRYAVEILTKPNETGKYGYALFEVFVLHDLVRLRRLEEDLGEITQLYRHFVLHGRVPYLVGLQIFPDHVEELYEIKIYNYIPKHLLRLRKLTTWLIHNDLVLRIRRKVKFEPYTRKKLLFITLNEEFDYDGEDCDDYEAGRRNFLFVYNDADEILFEV